MSDIELISCEQILQGQQSWNIQIGKESLLFLLKWNNFSYSRTLYLNDELVYEIENSPQKVTQTFKDLEISIEEIDTIQFVLTLNQNKIEDSKIKQIKYDPVKDCDETQSQIDGNNDEIQNKRTENDQKNEQGNDQKELNDEQKLNNQQNNIDQNSKLEANVDDGPVQENQWCMFPQSCKTCLIY